MAEDSEIQNLRDANQFQKKEIEIQLLKDNILRQKEHLKNTSEKIINIDESILDYKNKILVLEASAKKIRLEIKQTNDKSQVLVDAANKIALTATKGNLIVNKETETFRQYQIRMKDYEEEANSIVKKLEAPVAVPHSPGPSEDLQQEIGIRIAELTEVQNNTENNLRFLIDQRDAVNLEICHAETECKILRNRNAAMALRLRKNIQSSETARRQILEKLEQHKRANE